MSYILLKKQTISVLTHVKLDVPISYLSLAC